MKGGLRMKTFALVMSLFVSVVLILQEAHGEDGVFADKIIVGASGDPESLSGSQEKLGVNLAFRVINDQGGIHGRMLAYLTYDDKNKPEIALEKTKIMVEQDKVFSILVDGGTPTSLKLMPYMEEKKVPFMFPHQGHHALVGKRYMFTSYPLYIYECDIMMKYLTQTRGFNKIGLIYADNAYGHIFLNKIKENASRFGFTVAGHVPIADRNPSDLGPQITELKGYGAQALIMALYVRQAQVTLETKQKLGWDDVVLVSTGPLTDEKLLNVPGGYGEGVIGLSYFHNPSSSTLSGIAIYRDLLKKYYSDQEPNRYSLYGYLYANLFAEGVRRAGADLTRERFIDAMEGIKNWENGVIPPVSFSATDHHAQDQAFIVELKNGKFDPITEWIRVD
jgi:ABC-type branched-subunit amino acid transport system substrate-binding protein